MTDTAETTTTETLTYTQYPAYKESGVDWLGEIPAHWKIVSSKRLFQLRKEKARKEDIQLTASQKHGIISQQEFMKLEGRRVTQVEFNNEILKHVEANDFVISMRSFQGGIEYSKYTGCVSSAYVALIPIKYIVPEFFKYLFKSDAYIKALSSTSNLVRDGQALRYENFSQVDLVIIPHDEQARIAEFLDRKTAQIDQAIAQKGRLIELLNERQQVMIYRAVTRGLNPDVPMKDSGIDWIGEIPGHWEVKKLKYNFKLVGGGTPRKERSDFWDGDIPWVSPKDMKTLYISSTEDYITEKGLKNSTSCLIDVNTLLIVVRSGILQRKIPVAISKEKLSINQDMKALIPNGVIKTEFIFYFVVGNDSFLRNEWVKKGATVESVEVELLKNCFIIIPPEKEQTNISDFLDQKTIQIEEVIEQQVRAIQKLQELKSTLINSAVTGKIKV